MASLLIVYFPRKETDMQTPPYPYAPPPPPEHRPAQPKRTLWSWYRQRGCFLQCVLGGCSLLVVAFVVLLCSVATPAFVRGFTGATLTPTAVATASVVSQRVVHIATNTPTVKASQKPTAATGPTHGNPRMGGPITDFAGKYGPSSGSGNGSNQLYWADVAHTIFLAVTPNIIKSVVDIVVSGPDSWDVTVAQNFCAQYLPDDAQEFNNTQGQDPFIDYHSSMGEIVMQLSPITCHMYVSS